MSISETLINSPHRGKWNGEDLVLSKNRVEYHGEVLTPPNIVSDMLDLVSKEFSCEIGKDTGTLPLDKTFLEPSCGTGNFLVQILNRKLNVARTEKEIFTAVSTIYGIDIQDDNVLESRLRLLEIVEEKYKSITGEDITVTFLEIIADVLEKNIILGNTLYEGVLKFEEKNGKIVPLKAPLSFKGGMVLLDNKGAIHKSNLISSRETYERAYFYKWSWGTSIEKEKSYLDENDTSEEKNEEVKTMSQADYFSKFASML